MFIKRNEWNFHGHENDKYPIVVSIVDCCIANKMHLPFERCNELAPTKVN